MWKKWWQTIKNEEEELSELKLMLSLFSFLDSTWISSMYALPDYTWTGKARSAIGFLWISTSVVICRAFFLSRIRVKYFFFLKCSLLVSWWCLYFHTKLYGNTCINKHSASVSLIQPYKSTRGWNWHGSGEVTQPVLLRQKSVQWGLVSHDAGLSLAASTALYYWRVKRVVLRMVSSIKTYWHTLSKCHFWSTVQFLCTKLFQCMQIFRGTIELAELYPIIFILLRRVDHTVFALLNGFPAAALLTAAVQKIHLFCSYQYFWCCCAT